MAFRLYYHAESDSLFIEEEDNQTDPFIEDVTDDPKMRVAAKLRGLKFDLAPPEVTSPKTFADAITSSYRRWHRKPADLYPTPVNGTESVMPALLVLAEYFEAHTGARPKVWEPACGDGRLSRVLEWHGFDVFSSDLRQHPGYGIANFDFLADHVSEYGWEPGEEVDMIVTNPPFGKAEEFIRKALSITGNVAMLLKQTYWNAASRLQFFHEHKPAFVLPLTFRLAFLESERGKSPLMDCCWVIWAEYGEENCIFEPIPKRVYPGYHGPGLRSAMAALEEALLDLTETTRGVVDEGRSASLLAGGRDGATPA